MGLIKMSNKKEYNFLTEQEQEWQKININNTIGVGILLFTFIFSKKCTVSKIISKNTFKYMKKFLNLENNSS